MGTGWRRAFCTTIPRNHNRTQTQTQTEKQQQGSSSSSSLCSSPTSKTKLGFLSNTTNGNSYSNPSTPRLHCKTSTTPSSKNSNPSSPRSPFSLFRTGAFRSSFKNNCGICSQSVKTGQGMAIFTAECSHEFHFPCISAHVKTPGSLVCPVCQANWREVPLLQIIKKQPIDKPVSPLSLSSSLSSSKYKQQQQLDQTNTYSDDEPLLSPRAGFIPIPEATNEEEEPEIQEFQGFFIDPNNTRKNHSHTKNFDVRVESNSDSALISVGRSHQTYALKLKVKAPSAQTRRSRAPIDLVTVLDVSGSMNDSKLQMLKRAMRLVISSLSSADRLSIVAFSGSPKRLLPLRRMTANGQHLARRIIDRLACGQGAACVGDALKKATKVLEDRRDRNPVASIMLLSDGGQQQDNDESDNNSTPAARRRWSSPLVSSTRFAHVEIPPMEPSQDDDAFAKCVGGLLSVVVQDLRLQLGFSRSASSVQLPEISAVYSCNGGRPTLLGSGGQVRIGDLYAEEERELLVELRIPISSSNVDAGLGAHHNVMSVQCCFKDPSNPHQDIISKDQAVLVPNLQSVRPSQHNMERLRNLFVTTRAIAESRRLVEINDLSNTFHLLSSARALVMQSSTGDDEHVHALEVELGELHVRRQYLYQLQQQQQQQQMQRRRTRTISPTTSNSTSERETPTAAAPFADEDGEPLTPSSAWRAAERLAKVAIMKKSLNRVGSDLHGFENARF